MYEKYYNFYSYDFIESLKNKFNFSDHEKLIHLDLEKIWFPPSSDQLEKILIIYCRFLFNKIGRLGKCLCILK